MIKLIRNIALLFLLVMVIQTVIYNVSLNNRFPLLGMINETLSGRIILFGDSSIDHYDTEDDDKRSIEDLLNDRLKVDSLVGWDQPAFDIGVFDAMLDHIIANEASPQLVIIPINMRSFSVIWKRRPEWQFQFEKQALRQDLLTPLKYSVRAFTEKDQISMSDYLNSPIVVNGKMEGVVSDYIGEQFSQYSNQNARQKYLANYMYDLTEDDLEVLKELCLKAKENSIPLFFYISPLPVEQGASLIGNDFRAIVFRNADLITEVVREEGFIIANWHDLFGEELFARDDLYKREHYSWSGKLILTDSIAGRLRQQGFK